VADFKRWKERIGHSIAVVTLEDIISKYSGIDDAEKIRNFLIQKFDDWRIHFVLLVGDMEEIPTRLMYANNQTDAYASDFYYANLSTSNWDLDNDNRWGEFSDDQFNYRYDVIVGRLPLNSATDINHYFDNVISFEQDIGPWKHSALFAGGFMDHDPTDGAELVEQIKAKILSPAGWTIRTLYEKGGTVPSKFPCDLDLNQTNYVNECSPQQQSLICLTAHGDWNKMFSKQCTDPPGKCNPDNDSENLFGEDSGINANFCSAIVYMNGCSTACPVREYKHVEPQPTSPPTTPTRSLFDFKPTHEHNGIRYVRNGAVAAIGASAGADYKHKWKNPNHGYCWSLAYYFYLQLIYYHKSVGEAFFRGMLQHAVRHDALERGVRDFYYMGDPSLILDGIICDSEVRNDVIVHQGHWNYFAACNDKNGDMYVAVSVGSYGRECEIYIYKSTDHGRTWSTWYSYKEDESILHIEVSVNRAGVIEFQDERLLVLYTTIKGKICILRIPLGGGDGQKVIIPIQPGGEKGLFNYLSVTQDSLDGESSIYLGYCFYDQWSKIKSVVGISDNNGLSWRDWSIMDGYYYPTVQVAPNNVLYFAAAHDDAECSIFVRRSGDLGINWGPWTNLTVGDTAIGHLPAGCGASIGVSTDPGYPAVWVSYQRTYDGKFGQHTNDIGFAYSLDEGQRWKRDLTLSVGPGYLNQCKLRGHLATRNQNIHAAYVSNIPGSHISGKNTNKIILRSASGENPERWSPSHIMNHNEASNYPPQLVNSPGAPSGGTGIVYGGSNYTILFSAPWI
jgi:hypothetical protein